MVEYKKDSCETHDSVISKEAVCLVCTQGKINNLEKVLRRPKSEEVQKRIEALVCLADQIDDVEKVRPSDVSYTLRQVAKLIDALSTQPDSVPDAG